MLLQINAAGVIRTDFGGGGVALISQVNSSNGSTDIQKTFIANPSSSANSNQFIIFGREDDGDGFMLKMFGTGNRPTAFNGGNTTNYSGGATATNGYIQDWVTGSFAYSVRLNGVSFSHPRVAFSAFSKETGAPLASFSDNGTVHILTPEGNIIDQSRPLRIVLPSTGAHSNKFYLAFSTIPVLGPGTGIALCRINTVGGRIDNGFGTNRL